MLAFQLLFLACFHFCSSCCLIPFSSLDTKVKNFILALFSRGGGGRVAVERIEKAMAYGLCLGRWKEEFFDVKRFGLMSRVHLCWLFPSSLSFGPDSSEGSLDLQIKQIRFFFLSDCFRFSSEKKRSLIDVGLAYLQGPKIQSKMSSLKEGLLREEEEIIFSGAIGIHDFHYKKQKKELISRRIS